MLQSPIVQQISDHNLLMKDRIITWNLWAPGTHNGHQQPDIERNASKAVSKFPYPQNVAPIIKARIDKEITYLIEYLKMVGSANVDAICLQETASSSHEPHIRSYLLSTLNLQLMANKLPEFIVTLDPQGMPLSESGHMLLSQTGTESFGQLTLPNTNLFSVSKAGTRDDLIVKGQDGRIFETQLQPKGRNVARTLWNVHLKWYQDSSHHQHIQTLIQAASQEGVTIAGDTNAPVNPLCKPYLHLIEIQGSIEADPNKPDTANKVAGGPAGYVDAIITPKSAPHIQQAQAASQPQVPTIPHCIKVGAGYTGLHQLFFTTMQDAQQFSKIMFDEMVITNEAGDGPKDPVSDHRGIFVRVTDKEYLAIQPLLAGNHLPPLPPVPKCLGIGQGQTLKRLLFSSPQDSIDFSELMFKEAGIGNQYNNFRRDPGYDQKDGDFVRASDKEIQDIDALLKGRHMRFR